MYAINACYLPTVLKSYGDSTTRPILCLMYAINACYLLNNSFGATFEGTDYGLQVYASPTYFFMYGKNIILPTKSNSTYPLSLRPTNLSKSKNQQPQLTVICVAKGGMGECMSPVKFLSKKNQTLNSTEFVMFSRIFAMYRRLLRLPRPCPRTPLGTSVPQTFSPLSKFLATPLLTISLRVSNYMQCTSSLFSLTRHTVCNSKLFIKPPPHASFSFLRTVTFILQACTLHNFLQAYLTLPDIIVRINDVFPQFKCTILISSFWCSV